MSDDNNEDFFKDEETHISKSLNPGEPGTKKLLNKNIFKGRIIKVRYNH